ncbi:MAG: DUF2911 domain-containing protein [Gilvibacter sp.]
MSKVTKIGLRVFGGIAVLVLLFFFVVGPIMKNQTKKHSPEKTVVFNQGDLTIDVFYCSPAKKDRKIFGELVPYGEVWRTGANEATTFSTSIDLTINGQTLPAGDYTLWTIPNEGAWDVIFNNKMYGWGVTLTMKTQREEEHDALVVNAPVSKSLVPQENFSITITETDPNTAIMMLAWDDVVVPVKMTH